MIAALYVETNGVYYGLPDVDPWDKERNALNYDGPHPVVAHPPCPRWSIIRDVLLDMARSASVTLDGCG